MTMHMQYLIHSICQLIIITIIILKTVYTVSKDSRTWVSQYQNVSIMDFISSKDDGDGGDSWSHKMRKAAVI